MNILRKTICLPLAIWLLLISLRVLTDQRIAPEKPMEILIFTIQLVFLVSLVYAIILPFETRIPKVIVYIGCAIVLIHLVYLLDFLFPHPYQYYRKIGIFLSLHWLYSVMVLYFLYAASKNRATEDGA